MAVEATLQADTNEVTGMVTQTVLPFKLEITRDVVTAHAGLALFGEFVHALKLPGLLDEALPAPGSPAGYQPSRVVLPPVLVLHGGGRGREGRRRVRGDPA